MRSVFGVAINYSFIVYSVHCFSILNTETGAIIFNLVVLCSYNSDVSSKTKPHSHQTIASCNYRRSNVNSGVLVSHVRY